MYRLSDTRVIETRYEEDEIIVVIRDIVSGKFIEIPANRWASFLLLQGDIDDAVKILQEKKDYVKYFEHFGGGWYVSVTTGFWCVDIRRFYKNNEIKPSKQGLAVRLTEWSALLDILPLLMTFDLAVACPCSIREDHTDPAVIRACRECTPFEDVM